MIVSTQSLQTQWLVSSRRVIVNMTCLFQQYDCSVRRAAYCALQALPTPDYNTRALKSPSPSFAPASAVCTSRARACAIIGAHAARRASTIGRLHFPLSLTLLPLSQYARCIYDVLSVFHKNVRYISI